MTSQINPTNIDGAYPVAGQDNNSQGFRDNFTNTKSNFQYAADEITDLQNKAVLKSALIGSVLNNDMGGSILSNAQLQNMTQTRVPLGTLALNGTASINYSAGSYQTFTTNGNNIIAFTSLPVSGVLATVAVQITVNSASDSVTFPAAVSINAQGIQGYTVSGNILSFAATGVYTFVFSTSDNGTTITVSQTNERLQPFNNSTEVLAASTGANLAVTTSRFTTAATGETGTLAAGVNGQIKILAYFSEGGASDTRIFTVSNAGWKSSGTGTITFTEFGQTATLMCINAKWFAISVGPGASDTFPTLA
jgi:hypothetical protein